MAVRQVAELAKLALSPEEEERMGRELEAVLDFAQALSSLDTQDVPMTAHVIPMENVFREDVPAPSMDREALLACAPARTRECVAVPQDVRVRRSCTMEKLTELTLTQTREALVRGRVSARELTQAWLDAMEAKEGDIGAFITRCPDRALAEAEAVDDARVRGEELPPLAGIPMAVKDNICVQGPAHHLRLQNAGGFHAPLRRHR